MSATRTRWRRWVVTSNNRKIFQAMVIVGIFTFGAKAISLVREQYIAAVFGTRDALDAYLVAIVLPSAISSIVAGSFNAALIPTYVRTRQDGGDAAQRLLSSVMFLSLLLLGAVTGLFAIASPFLFPYLASGFNPDKLDLTRHLGYLVMPIIVITGATTIWSAVLNADERFALTALSAAVVPVVAILALVLGRSALGIYALAIGFVLGVLLQLGVVAWGIHRQGLSLIPRWHGADPALRQVIAQYLPMVAGQLVMSVGPVIDQGMAATLQGGSVSALTYGNKLVALVLGIGSAALGTAVLPYFSRMVAADDWEGVRHTLRTYVKLILLVTLPVTLFAVFLSGDLVRLLFQRGAFTQSDTHVVSGVQAMYALQIPFYSLGILLVRLISSMKLNQILLYGTLISFSLNFSLDYLLKNVMGVSGIALSTTIVYVAALIFYSIVTSRVLKRKVSVCG